MGVRPRIMTGKPFQYTRETSKNMVFMTRVGWDHINERSENAKNHVLALQDMPEINYEDLWLVWKVAPGGAKNPLKTMQIRSKSPVADIGYSPGSAFDAFARFIPQQNLSI